VLTLALFKTTVHPYAAHVEIRRAAAAVVPVWTLKARVRRRDGVDFDGATLMGFIARGLSDGRTRDEMAEEGRAGALAYDFIEFSRARHQPYPRAIVGIEGVSGPPSRGAGEAQLLIHEVIEALVIPADARLIACGRREADRLEYERYGLTAMKWEPDAFTMTPTMLQKPESVRAWLRGLGACGEYTKVE